MKDNDIIICRCEDITLADLRQKIKEGYTDLEELKRILRIGMGPCQGNTCMQLLHRELSNYLNIKAEELPLPKSRPLTVGVSLKAIMENANDES